MDAWEDRRTERGDIITGWLVQMLAVLAVLGVLAHEVIAIGVNRVALDDVARDAARAGGRDAAAAVAGDRGAELADFREMDGALVVTVTRPARTLLVHHIGPLADLAQAEATARADGLP